MTVCAKLGDGLEQIFRARSIALVGASSDPTKTGGRPISLLKRHGFAGAIYPVNPKGGMIQGLVAYERVGDLPEIPDLAIVAVPGAAAVEAVRDCSKKGIGATIVLSAGFAEQGSDGAALQAELRRIGSESGMRVLGPNCLGTVSVPERVIGTFSVALETEMPAEGPIAIVSQSGNIGSVAMKLLDRAGAGLSRFMATGNECDIDIADGIAWLARDPATSAILCCMETCRDAGRLTDALDLAREAGKPVVVLKIGASEAGQAAALSHTGGLAGGDRVFDAVFARHGAVRVKSLERLVELGSAIAALGDRRIGRDPSVVPVAASGGFGIMMADAASAAGLRMVPVSAGAAARIKAVLPLASAANPVDATAQMSANPEVMDELLSALLEDEANDIVCMMMALGLEVPRLRGVFLDVFRRLRARYPERCLVAVASGPADAVAELNGMGIVCFQTIDSTFEGIAALARLSTARGQPADRQVRSSAPAATPIDAEAFRNEAGAKRSLAAAGIPVPEEHVAATEKEVAAAAANFGRPVAMKILSPDIQHKSDIGGVELGVDGVDAACAAFRRIMSAAAAAAPGARIDGILVTPMAGNGVELILGTTLDPIFGPVVMVGLGGVFAEIFRDTALRPAPVAPEEAEDMLRELKAFPLLAGARGRPPADVAAAAAAIAALSEFAFAHAEEIAEIDVNPLLVRQAGAGAVALDALLIPAGNSQVDSRP